MQNFEKKKIVMVEHSLHRTEAKSQLICLIITYLFFATCTVKSLVLKLKKKKFKYDRDIYYPQTKVV